MAVQEQKTSAQIQQKEAELKKLNDDLELELAQAAIDIAGIADPTPITDVIGAGLSLFRGDLIGAGLSLISVIPYAGDAIAKTAKGARLAKKIADLERRISAAIDVLRQAIAAQYAARRKLAAAVRAKRQAEKAKKIAAAKKCNPCKPPGGNDFGTQSPKEGSNGSWRDGERANSDWYPDPNTKKGQEVLEATGGQPIKFVDGYPVFSPYAMKLPDGSSARFEIDMQGDHRDFIAARDAMRTKLDDPNWPGTPNRNAPKAALTHDCSV